MELHELHVDHPRSGTIGDGDPITTRPGRIRRAQENLPQSARGQHGMACHTALHVPGGLLKQIRSHTALRGVNVQAVQGVVRRCQQVNGGMPGEQGDVGMRLERSYQRLTNGFAGSISGVNDARHRVAALPGQRQFPAGHTIKRHAQALEQHLLHQPWTLFGKNAGRLVTGVPCPGAQNIRHQELWRIFFAPINDAALGPVGIGVIGDQPPGSRR